MHLVCSTASALQPQAMLYWQGQASNLSSLRWEVLWAVWFWVRCAGNPQAQSMRHWAHTDLQPGYGSCC